MQDNKFFAELIKEIKKNGLEANNLFAIKYYQENKKLIYINKFTEKYDNYILINKGYDLRKLSKGYNKIIFHNLFKEDVKQLSRFEKHKEIIYWRQWTGDSFRLINLAQPYTKNTLNHIFLQKIRRKIKNIFLFKLVNNILVFIYKIKNYKNYRNSQIALSKIDYAMNWYKLETDLLKINFKNFKAKHFYHGYFSNKEKVINENIGLNKSTLNSLKVFLGHNGHLGTNYLEVLYYLSKIKIFANKEIRISCILSYGNKDYIKKVISVGEKLFKDDFAPITEFISTEEYFKFAYSHNVFIFNSHRPVGAKNIFTAIEIGAKVYLNSQNPMFNYFKGMGVKCFPTLELESNIMSIFEPINYEDKNNNIRIMKKRTVDNMSSYKFAIEQIIN